jgi:hypothetical protein
MARTKVQNTTVVTAGFKTVVNDKGEKVRKEVMATDGKGKQHRFAFIVAAIPVELDSDGLPMTEAYTAANGVVFYKVNSGVSKLVLDKDTPPLEVSLEVEYPADRSGKHDIVKGEKTTQTPDTVGLDLDI